MCLNAGRNVSIKVSLINLLRVPSHLPNKIHTAEPICCYAVLSPGHGRYKDGYVTIKIQFFLYQHLILPLFSLVAFPRILPLYTIPRTIL